MRVPEWSFIALVITVACGTPSQPVLAPLVRKISPGKAAVRVIGPDQWRSAPQAQPEERARFRNILAADLRAAGYDLDDGAPVAIAFHDEFSANDMTVFFRAGTQQLDSFALELRNHTRELTADNAQYLTDVVRQAALKADTGADVMTRENLLVLLQASGKDLANCEGECEVDTGRRIGADAVISGDVQKLGSKFKVSLRLHDTREGKLLASATGTGATVDDLDDSVTKAAQQLFER